MKKMIAPLIAAATLSLFSVFSIGSQANFDWAETTDNFDWAATTNFDWAMGTANFDWAAVAPTNFDWA